MSDFVQGFIAAYIFSALILCVLIACGFLHFEGGRG